MVSESLVRKIQLVLQHSERQMYRIVSTGRMTTGAAFVQERPGEYVLMNDQVGALRKLQAISDAPDQAGFAGALLAMIEEDNAAVVAQVLVELHETEELRSLSGFDRAHAALWNGLKDKLCTEPWLFTDADLGNLRAGLTATVACAEPWLHRRDSYALQLRSDAARAMHGQVVPEVMRIIERVEYLRLLNDLRGVTNPVVDPDRRILRSGLWELGFSQSLARTLDEVERKAALAAYRAPSHGGRKPLFPLPRILSRDPHEQVD